MSANKRRRLAILALASAILVFSAGCGIVRPRGGPSEQRRANDVHAQVDWAARTIALTGLQGVEVDFCEGEAPMLCIQRKNQWLGGIELGSYPNASTLLARGLDAWSSDFARWLQEDRRRGCSPSYDVVEEDAQNIAFAGARGRRFIYTASIDGKVVERVVRLAARIDDTLYTLNLNALGDQSCLAREGEVPLEEVDDLLPVLVAIAAGSKNVQSQ